MGEYLAIVTSVASSCVAGCVPSRLLYFYRACFGLLLVGFGGFCLVVVVKTTCTLVQRHKPQNVRLGSTSAPLARDNLRGQSSVCAREHFWEQRSKRATMNEAGLRSSADGTSCELLSMPHEVLLNILSFLDAKDLCILCFVSTELRGLAEDDAPWTSLWHSKFPPLLLLSHKHGNLTQFNLCIYSHSRALAHLQREFPSRKLMYRERILTRQRWSKRPRVVAYSLHETLLRTLQVTVK